MIDFVIFDRGWLLVACVVSSPPRSSSGSPVVIWSVERTRIGNIQVSEIIN